ncbi:uncharacterized protein LOC104903484 [Beta vulgaris subsp. vulgaris]|uniref:uncharacterized protein LOC104903484 n=1 Tax=Beta vulgaris subsp. vulgaris TaxID=3555 RepID=UPI0020369BFE|nr:uncharacterized protein LOC104903484 [Beta vulgaris subsp. vulgaris]
MSVLQQYPETMNSKDLQIWNNAAFDSGVSENSTINSKDVNFSWSNMNPLSSINLSQSLESDSIKENQSPSMVDSSVSVKSLSVITPLQANTVIANTQQKPICKMGVSEKKIHEIVNQDFPEERDIDFEIEEIEKEINRLSSRLESLRLEKAKRNAKMMEKRGRIIAAKFMDPPKQSNKSFNEQSKIEESMSLSAKLKTPRRGLSMGPAEIMRGVRRGISLGPAEIYSATKLKQFGKQEMTTPVQKSANRRKSCYWKLHDIDELRVTKERGKSMSLSPKGRSKTGSKAQQVPKQAATTVGAKKTMKKEDAVISSIQPKKLFIRDGEKSAPGKKPLKSGRVISSRYNQGTNGGNSAVKDLRKRSLPETEEELKRTDKKRVSLTEKSQRGEQLATESRVKKRWEFSSEQTSVDHSKTQLSVSKVLDMVPKIKNQRCTNESPRDSGPAKRVSELIGRKSIFSTEEDDDCVIQALSFAEEQVIEECPKIRIVRRVDESPRDSGAVKRVSELVGRKSFFNEDEDEMPVFSFEEEHCEEN